MRTAKWWMCLHAAMVAAGCDGAPASSPPQDVGGGGDTARVDVGDDAAPPDVGPDVGPDASPPPSMAGGPCRSDSDCAGMLQCATVIAGGQCIQGCTNDPSAEREAEQCGGPGSTCLSPGVGASQGACVQACTALAREGTPRACRPGFICTGLPNQRNPPDARGCGIFCTEDSHCGGETPRCNPRRGACGTAGVNMARLPDGAPCDPSVNEMVPGEPAPRNTQCRGACFLASTTDRTQGICGSIINLRVTRSCPDGNNVMTTYANDEGAACVFRPCSSDCECAGRLRCIYPEVGGTIADSRPRACRYPTAAQPTGVPCLEGDGGAATDAMASPD